MSFLLAPLRRTTTALPQTTRAAFSTTPAARLARMTLVGRLGADPEVKQAGNSQFVEFPVGASYGPKDNRQTSWYRVTSFAPEDSGTRNITLSLTKGTLVYLEADARMKTYEDAEGKTRSALNLYSTKVEVLKRPQPKEGEEGASGANGV